eukprot:3894155-Ditylum_brightwellii.AAC.1
MDGVRVADKYFDARRQRSNNSLDSGMRSLLIDHTSTLPPLSKVYNQDGAEEVRNDKQRAICSQKEDLLSMEEVDNQ